MSSGSVIYNPIFQYYGIEPEVEVFTDVYGGSSLSFAAEFYSADSYKTFVNDLEQMQKARAEREIRKKNPMLQRAYDDYQILLKLSK